MTGTFPEFLTERSETDITLGARRSFAGETFHTVRQLIGEMPRELGVPEKVPYPVHFEDATSDELLQWWESFRSWLKSLTTAQLEWLNSQEIRW